MQHIAKYILIYIRHFCSICLLPSSYIIVTQWQNGDLDTITYLKIIHSVRKLRQPGPLLTCLPPLFCIPKNRMMSGTCSSLRPTSTTLQYLSRHRCMGDYCILLCKFDTSYFVSTTASAILYYKSFNFLCFGMEIGKMKKV